MISSKQQHRSVGGGGGNWYNPNQGPEAREVPGLERRPLPLWVCLPHIPKAMRHGGPPPSAPILDMGCEKQKENFLSRLGASSSSICSWMEVNSFITCPKVTVTLTGVLGR